MPKVSAEHMFTLINASTAELNRFAADPAVPLLFFTGTLYQEIRHLVSLRPKDEFAVFLLLEKIDENRPHFLATDFYMPKQTASAASVKLDVPDCLEFYKASGCKQRFIAHLHSHATFGAQWSSTDNEQQLSREDLGFMDDYRFYIVLNTKGDITASFVCYTPVLTRTEAKVGVSFSEPEHCLHLTKQRKEALAKMLKEKIVTPPPLPAIETKSWAYNPESWIKPIATPKKHSILEEIVDLYNYSPADSDRDYQGELSDLILDSMSQSWIVDEAEAEWLAEFVNEYVDELFNLEKEGFNPSTTTVGVKVHRYMSDKVPPQQFLDAIVEDVIVAAKGNRIGNIKTCWA